MSATPDRALREAARLMAEYLDHRVGCPAKGPPKSPDDCTCGLEAILSIPLSRESLLDPPHYDGAPHCAGTSRFGPDHARLCIRYSEHDSRALDTSYHRRRVARRLATPRTETSE